MSEAMSTEEYLWSKMVKTREAYIKMRATEPKSLGTMLARVAIESAFRDWVGMIENDIKDWEAYHRDLKEKGWTEFGPGASVTSKLKPSKRI